MPLVDVLRAAVSEIEQYQRIVVQAPPQATVVGRATSDVIHLLAELLDNATNFSPPESQVVMSSVRAQDGSIVVEIADSGVGMAEHELTDANRRLATPSAVDVSASRRMGLFVVGRLGARHGIAVHLGGAPMGGPGGGLTASVTLPAHLVTVTGDAGDTSPAARPSAFGAPAAPNGVPPQRANMQRLVQRATLASPPDGRLAERPTGLNGLPTRTPGSSLLRTPAAEPERETDGRDTVDPPAAEPPVTPSSAPGDEQPVTERAAHPDVDDADADAAPTEAVPITPTAMPAEGRAEPTDGPGDTDGPDDTEDSADEATPEAAATEAGAVEFEQEAPADPGTTDRTRPPGSRRPPSNPRTPPTARCPTSGNERRRPVRRRTRSPRPRRRRPGRSPRTTTHRTTTHQHHARARRPDRASAPGPHPARRPRRARTAHTATCRCRARRTTGGSMSRAERGAERFHGTGCHAPDRSAHHAPAGRRGGRGHAGVRPRRCRGRR